MSPLLKKSLFALLLLFFALPFFNMACVGGNPATSPSAPVEAPVPVSLKFIEYQEMKVDLSSIGGSKALLQMALSKVVGDNVSGIIVSGPTLISTLEQKFFIPSINSLSELEVPTYVPSACVNVTTRRTDPDCLATYAAGYCFLADGTANPACQPAETYVKSMVFSAASGLLAGSHLVEIDFAKYDYNNDAQLENCSGNAANLPICVRFWLDGNKYSAWIFDSYPVADDPATPDVNEANIGQGKFKLFIADMEGYEVTMQYIYAQQLADAQAATVDQKGIEHFMKAVFVYDASTCHGIGCVNLNFDEIDWHSQTSQEGPAATAFKSVNLTAGLQQQNVAPPIDWITSQYLSQFVEGFDFWSGSVSSSDTQTTIAKTDICAMISTGLEVDNSLCANVNGRDIRVDGLPFVPAMTNADVAFPIDFPATPTF